MGRNSKKLTTKFCGFSLTELLIVITVIGVFSGLLFPIGQKIVTKARMSCDAQNLRQIALSYRLVIENQEKLIQITSINDWAIFLAQNGGINDPQCYSSRLSLPSKCKKIIDRSGVPENDFLQLTSDWVCLSPLPLDAPVETTPLLFSRGLDALTGKWTEKSLYGIQGGYIVFLDGHVQFYHNLNQELTHYITGRTTSNIQEAVPAYTHAYDSSGQLW